MAIEIVDLPTKMVNFHSYANVYRRVIRWMAALSIKRYKTSPYYLRFGGCDGDVLMYPWYMPFPVWGWWFYGWFFSKQVWKTIHRSGKWLSKSWVWIYTCHSMTIFRGDVMGMFQDTQWLISNFPQDIWEITTTLLRRHWNDGIEVIIPK